MIPTIRLCEHPRNRKQEKSAFARGPKERALHLIVDVDSFDPEDGTVAAIRGFGANPNISVEEIRMAQVTIGEHGTIDWESSGNERREAVGHVAHNIRCIEGWGESLDRVTEPQLDERLALAMHARFQNCDGLVAASPQVLRLARRFYPESNPLTPTEAIAVIGLHLRLREDYVLDERPGFRFTGRGIDFYTTLAHGMLPDLARWLEYGPPPDEGDLAAQGLATGLMLRMARTLRFRDRVHGYALREPSVTNGDETLSYFDGFLVALVGVFDIAARVANTVYSLGQPRRASWREAGWRSRLVATEARMGTVLADEATERDVIETVYALRNTIHSEPLPALGMLKTTGALSEYRAVLPSVVRTALAEPLARLGGAEAWGFEDLGAGTASLRPTAFVEAAVPASARALTSLMQAVQFESVDTEVDQVELPDELAAILPRVRCLGGLALPGDEQGLATRPRA